MKVWRMVKLRCRELFVASVELGSRVRLLGSRSRSQRNWRSSIWIKVSELSSLSFVFVGRGDSDVVVG